MPRTAPRFCLVGALPAASLHLTQVASSRMWGWLASEGSRCRGSVAASSGDERVPRRLAGAHAADAHGSRHALGLPGGDAVGHRLRYGGDDRAVDARVALDWVLREAAAGARLRDPEVDGADAGGEPAPAVAVAPVAGLACLVGPGAHDLVDGRLGHRPDQLGHARHAVVESGHLGAAARDLAHLAHTRLSPFFGSRLQRLEFQAIPAPCFLRPGKRPLAPTLIIICIRLALDVILLHGRHLDCVRRQRLTHTPTVAVG